VELAATRVAAGVPVGHPAARCTKGQECDTCSKDEDCEAGFVCSTFNDGSQRCGAGTGVTMCRVR
jgi:hypothetical protein